MEARAGLDMRARELDYRDNDESPVFALCFTCLIIDKTLSTPTRIPGRSPEGGPQAPLCVVFKRRGPGEGKGSRAAAEVPLDGKIEIPPRAVFLSFGSFLSFDGSKERKRTCPVHLPRWTKALRPSGGIPPPFQGNSPVHLRWTYPACRRLPRSPSGTSPSALRAEYPRLTAGTCCGGCAPHRHF